MGNNGAMVSDFSRPGAIDLSALSAPRSSSPPSGTPAGAFVVDVTEQTFQTEVIDRSSTVPVVIDFWADWCGPCKQLSPVLEKLAGEYAGQFMLAKIDIEANKQIAAAAQVQSIPMVIGVVAGQVVPLFAGAYPEAEVRQYLDQLINVASQNGVSGRVSAPTEAAAEPATDTRLDDAYSAIERGDWAAAKAAYASILAERPNDPEATAGLAQVGLLARISSQDADVVARADANPMDVELACDAADQQLAAGRVGEAFDRLVAAVRTSGGDDRERAKKHLLDLFTVVGSGDPRVAQARTALANALF